jgi:hypothetical protein
MGFISIDHFLPQLQKASGFSPALLWAGLRSGCHTTKSRRFRSKIGSRTRQDILKEKRAGYGEEIISTLSIQWVKEFGNGFSRTNLFRMVRFAEVFPERKIVVTLSRQLSWSHFVEIIPFKDNLQRDFYAEMCRKNHRADRAVAIG